MTDHPREIPSHAPPQSAGDAVFRLTDDDVREFREVVHAATGEWLSFELAAARANALLMLARVVAGPLPEDEAVQTSLLLPTSPISG